MAETLSFGSWVKRRRKALLMTQQDLAHLVGCSQSALVKIEMDSAGPQRKSQRGWWNTFR